MQVIKLRAGLTAYGLSVANLRKGEIGCQLHVLRVIGSPIFAPSGHDFAVMTYGYKDPAVYHVEAIDSGISSEPASWLPDHEDEYCLVVYRQGVAMCASVA